MFSTPARQRTTQSRAPSSAQSRTQSSALRAHSSASRGNPSSAQRSTPQTINIPELPPYEAPEAPLSREAQRQLAALFHTQEYNALKTHLEHASQELTKTAGQVNEKLCDARIRYERARESRRNKNNDEGEEEEDDTVGDRELERLGDLERRTDAVTGQMEEKMRAVIDSEVRVQTLMESIQQLQREEEEAQTASLGPRMTRAQRRRDDEENEERDGDEDPEDENYEGTPEREARERTARNPPTQRLTEALSEGSEKWKELTLTERYAGHNTYIGFYRMVHDAKFPNEEAPPLPHSSTWFEHMEDPNVSKVSSGQQRSTRSRAQPSDESDDDIAIERERISMKCPLTLLPYQDPVTSTKCPHSFERQAIYDMIGRSTMYAPHGAGRGRVRALRCPVCSMTLTKDDLRPDPVLLRRVRRAEEIAARDAEEQLEGPSQLANAANQVTLASDAVEADDMDVDVDVDDAPVPSARVKMEPTAMLAERREASTDGDEEDEDVEEGDNEDEEDVEMDSEEE